jgi:N-acetylneuraminic acid mutarotase
MLRFVSSIIILINFVSLVKAQGEWEWTELSDLPYPTSNNALTEAVVNGKKYVYSFGGISDSLHPENIHQRVFKYDVLNNTWSQQPLIPDTLGKIAAGASFVNNKIYVMGGYHVDSSFNEYSSDRVHVYNPFIDTFEVDGAPIPTPIDDHVQAVWRDSLIYVVTGWSNTSNVPQVQVYNPFFNSWLTAEAVPDDNTFKAFGASGYILGDTIYYYGGVSGGFNFTSQSFFRRGIINPEDPTQIEWEIADEPAGGDNYRMACSGHNKTVFFVGGAEIAYNFDALAYSDGEQVFPNQRILKYNVSEASYENTFNTTHDPMDLRGIAKLGGGNWIIAGGIDTSRVASPSTYLLHNSNLSDVEEAIQPPFFEVTEQQDYYIVETENVGDVNVYDIQGRTLFDSAKSLANLWIPKSTLGKGILLFVFDNNTNVPITLKRVNP